MKVHEYVYQDRAAIYLGIDPGLSGAIAGIDATGTVWELCDTPTLTIQKARGARRDFDVALMVRTLAGIQAAYHVRRVVLERVLPMPNSARGSIGAFGIGRSAGLWEGIVAALGLRVELVVPRAWQAKILGGYAGKDGSRLKACQVFPDAADRLARKKDDGRSDALLLAEYGRRLG